MRLKSRIEKLEAKTSSDLQVHIQRRILGSPTEPGESPEVQSIIVRSEGKPGTHQFYRRDGESAEELHSRVQLEIDASSSARHNILLEDDVEKL